MQKEYLLELSLLKKAPKRHSPCKQLSKKESNTKYIHPIRPPRHSSILCLEARVNEKKMKKKLTCAKDALISAPLVL